MWVLVLMGLLIAAPTWTIHGLSTGPADVAIVGTVITYVVQRRRIQMSFTLIAAVVWLLALFLSLHSALHLDNLLRAVRIGEALSLLLVLPLNLNLTFDDVKWWLLGGGAVALLVGLALFARNVDRLVQGRPQYIYIGHHAIPRATGYFGDAAQFGTYAAFEIVVATIVLFGPAGRPSRIMAIGAIGLGGLALAASYSRTSVVFLSVALTATLAIRLGWNRYVLPMAGIALLLIGLLTIQRSSADPSTGRLTHWTTMFHNFVARGPETWLTGVGYKLIANDSSNVILRGVPGDHRFLSVDNNYLSALFETGVLGLVAMLVWIAAMGRSILRATHSRLRTLTLAAFLGLLAEALTTDALTYYRLVGLVAILVAVLPWNGARASAGSLQRGGLDPQLRS